jgi:hypothetical protein
LSGNSLPRAVALGMCWPCTDTAGGDKPARNFAACKPCMSVCVRVTVHNAACMPLPSVQGMAVCAGDGAHRAQARAAAQVGLVPSGPQAGERHLAAILQLMDTHRLWQRCSDWYGACASDVKHAYSCIAAHSQVASASTGRRMARLLMPLCSNTAASRN